MPINTNPADYLLKYISTTDTDVLLDIWHSNQDDVWCDHATNLDVKDTHPRVHDLSGGRHTKNTTQQLVHVVLKEKGDAFAVGGPGSIFVETWMLLRRMFQFSVRDLQVYIARAIFFFFVTILISTVYLKTRDRTLEFAVERVIQIGWIFAVPSLLTIVHVHKSCVEYTNMSHEVRLGFYRPISYVIARLLIEIPFMILLSISALGIGGFLLGGLNVHAFWAMLFIYASMLYAFETIAQVCSTTFSDSNMNMLLFVVVWFGSFLMSEIWVAEEDVIMLFRPFFYMSPLRLSMRAFAYLDFHDISFSCRDGLSLFQALNGGTCVGEYDGDMVLDSIGTFIFPAFQSGIDVAWCFWSTAIFGLAMKIIYATSLTYKVSSSTNINKSREIQNASVVKFIIKPLSGPALIFGVYASLLVFAGTKKEISYGTKECISKLNEIGFNLDDFENYPNFFDNNSTMILPRAGIYKGADAIKEYVQFASQVSPYFAEATILRTDLNFRGFSEDSGTCSFRQTLLIGATFDSLNTGSNMTFNETLMAGIEFKPANQVIERALIYYDHSFLSFFLASLLN